MLFVAGFGDDAVLLGFMCLSALSIVRGHGVGRVVVEVEADLPLNVYHF